MERENLAGDAKGKGTSGANREGTTLACIFLISVAVSSQFFILAVEPFLFAQPPRAVRRYSRSSTCYGHGPGTPSRIGGCMCCARRGRGDFFSLDEAKWARVFEDKLDGTARCIRLAVPLMRSRKWGRIVNVLGGAARQPQPAAVSVGLNNAAILNLIKAIAGDLAKDGILINAVIPSVVHSERLDETIRAEAARSGKTEAEARAARVARIPLGRMGEGREVGAVVAFLASERASFVTGSAWAVDGGAAAVI
jgi:NAD(P)-dependent dehydrogenase (short-subunit alcohol dehydrogenase family)